MKRQIAQSPPQPSIKERFPRDQLPLSELPQFLNGQLKLNVPVYTVWGACEDVQVLEKLRSGEYKVENLFIIDEAHSRLLDVGGVKLRLLGLGGAVVMHKLFDNGEGRSTIAGGQGTMWTTLLQMGELIDTANRVYDPTETRVFVTHASPAREGLLNQLSVSLKADFSISAGLHFRYGSSYNEFSVNPTLDHYRGKLAASKASFDDVWQTVKGEVEPAVSENEPQQRLLHYALDLVSKMPVVANGGNPFGGQVGAPGSGQIDESAFKNMWNFNLADAAYGWLVLDIDGGRIGTEMRAQGFNFAHRGGKVQPGQPGQGPAGNMASGPGGNVTAQHMPSLQTRPSSVPGQQPPPSGGPGPNPQGPRPAVRTGPSPAPGASVQSIKPATPQPASNTPGAGGDRSAGPDSKANGTGPRPDNDRRVPSGPPIPSTALFVRNANDDDAIRNLIAEQDRANVTSIEKSGRFFHVHFKTSDEMHGALDRVPKENKIKGPSNEITFSVYRESGLGHREDSWRGRGASSGPGAGGYRSGGDRTGAGASDSEGGRGGFRGRGRGIRGNTERGGRGRGGRGGFSKPGDNPASSPAPSTSAPEPKTDS